MLFVSIHACLSIVKFFVFVIFIVVLFDTVLDCNVYFIGYFYANTAYYC